MNNKNNKKIIYIILSFLIILILFFIIIFYFYTNFGLKNITNISEYNYNNCNQIYNTKLDSFFVKNNYKEIISNQKIDCNKMYYDIKLYSNIENNIQNKIESPLLYKNTFINGSIKEGGKYDNDIQISKNINIDKSNFELYFSNDNLEILENIILKFPKKIDGTLEDIISLLYIKNLYLKNKDKIINSSINNIEDNSLILDRIYLFQNKDGGFKKYILDNQSDIETTFYISKILFKLKELGININENILKSSKDFLKNNEYLEDDIELLKTKYVNSETSVIEKSIILSNLIDNNYKDKNRIEEIKNKLTKINLNNYFLRQKQKLYLFEAFIKYSNKYSNNEGKTKFGFMLGTVRNPEKVFWVGRVVPSFKDYIYKAKKVVYDNEAFFRVVNIEGKEFNFGLYFKEYLNNFKKIDSEGLKIIREFYKINSEKDFKKCILSEYSNCDSLNEKLETNIFDESNIYKVNISIKAQNNIDEIIFEDFIPDNFEYIKLKDNYINNPNYKYIKYNNNNLKIIFNPNTKIDFTYYIKPKSKGVFTYYPAMIYSQNNTNNISSTELFKVEVK